MIGGGPTVTAKRPATYEDLRAVPDHKVAEILAGPFDAVGLAKGRWWVPEEVTGGDEASARQTPG